MKFSDFDFGAIARMMDSLSDEQKEQVSSMADSMLNNMQNNMAAATEEENESQDYLEYLGLDEEFAGKLPSSVLNSLEAASDMEQFYEEIPEADYSASVLFLAKAVLQLLRQNAAPLLQKAGAAGFTSPSQTTLFQYASGLNKEQVLSSAQENGTEAETLKDLAASLMQLYILLQRAEFDVIRKQDLDTAKALVIDNGLLENIFSLDTDAADDQSAD